MTWLQRYRLRRWFHDSIWILPTVGIVAGLVAARLLHALELGLAWEWNFNPDTARAVLGTMAASMFTFIVFVSSALLVAVQLASAQLSPRIIGIVFGDRVTRLSLTIFVFCFTFILAVLVLIGDATPRLTSTLAAYASLVGLAVFLFLIDHVGKALRPSGALWAVAALGQRVIEDVYPRRWETGETRPSEPAPTQPASRTVRSDCYGAIRAFDVAGLTRLAQRADCIIELVPQVGDFIARGDLLFRLHGNANGLTEAELRDAVAVGQERTLEQDPAFAFRIIVDVASKGLSPAINDPTTASLAIDQIQHLLRAVGERRLDDERVRDSAGKLRLLYRTPDWDDYVHLAVTEIRQFGGSSIQIARRLKAMLESLIATLPEPRTALLKRELSLLKRSAERFFVEPEDRALAEISDSQGVGGKAAGLGGSSVP